MDCSPSRMSHQPLVESIEKPCEAVAKLPALLPAFDDSFSSPFPRPSSKRKFAEDGPTFPQQELTYYPTPVPTSSTGIFTSSPSQCRPTLPRTVSALSERAPLGAVPTVHLPVDGELVRMGRSSNSADYQLSTNRLISRVHVQATYHAPDASYPQGHVEVECLGWNGAKIHCRGRVFELNKGDTYISENRESEIMLDVQDTRVMIAWPANSSQKLSWDSEEDDMPTPTRRRLQPTFHSSPPLVPRSPVSQSPIRPPLFTGLDIETLSEPVHVFEDADGDGESGSADSPGSASKTFTRPSLPSSRSSQEPDLDVIDSKASIQSSFSADDFSDNNEENDPIVHSFGPFGQNLLGGLASFNTATPTQSNTSKLRAVPSSPVLKHQSPESVRFQESPIKNHVINQLAFSRIHSQPLSIIYHNLPSELKAPVTKTSEAQGSDCTGTLTPLPQLSKLNLKKILDETPCIGEIPRAGKDAAGQSLENEFYYVPEMDSNDIRRETITAGTRSTGLRAVRRTHKQYYWKKPRI